MQVFNPKWREYDNYQSNDATCTTQGLKGPLVKGMQGIRGHAPTYQARGPTGQPPRKGGEPGPTGQVRPNRSVRPNLEWRPIFLPRLPRVQTDLRKQSTPWMSEVGGSEGSAEPYGSAEPTLASVGCLSRQVSSLLLLPINIRWGGQNRAPTFGQEQETHSLSLSLGSSGVRVRVS